MSTLRDIRNQVFNETPNNFAHHVFDVTNWRGSFETPFREITFEPPPVDVAEGQQHKDNCGSNQKSSVHFVLPVAPRMAFHDAADYGTLVMSRVRRIGAMVALGVGPCEPLASDDQKDDPSCKQQQGQRDHDLICCHDVEIGRSECHFKSCVSGAGAAGPTSGGPLGLAGAGALGPVGVEFGSSDAMSALAPSHSGGRSGRARPRRRLGASGVARTGRVRTSVPANRRPNAAAFSAYVSTANNPARVVMPKAFRDVIVAKIPCRASRSRAILSTSSILGVPKRQKQEDTPWLNTIFPNPRRTARTVFRWTADLGLAGWRLCLSAGSLCWSCCMPFSAAPACLTQRARHLRRLLPQWSDGVGRGDGYGASLGTLSETQITDGYTTCHIQTTNHAARITPLKVLGMPSKALLKARLNNTRLPVGSERIGGHGIFLARFRALSACPTQRSITEVCAC